MSLGAARRRFLIGYGIVALFAAMVFNLVGHFDPCATEPVAPLYFWAAGAAWLIVLLATGAAASRLLYRAAWLIGSTRRAGVAWLATTLALFAGFVIGGLTISPLSGGISPPLGPLLILAGVLGVCMSLGSLLPYLLVERLDFSVVDGA